MPRSRLVSSKISTTHINVDKTLPHAIVVEFGRAIISVLTGL